ncbi:MAG: hypothetical protein JNM80_07530 [Phycisphaerae bacterium]|nr:hypothetical protein [Phycisphaerae bacterium]
MTPPGGDPIPPAPDPPPPDSSHAAPPSDDSPRAAPSPDTHPTPEPVADPAAAPDAPPPARELAADPWAHRRGEPRAFAFLWTAFLFVATVSTFVAVASRGQVDPALMRAAGRTLFVIVAVGVCILWPMVRLSQLPPSNPLVGSAQDLVVVLIPVQAVVWPQWVRWLAHWPFDVVAAVAVSITAWGTLVAGVLALAQVQRLRAAHRLAPDPGLWWMAAIAAVVVMGAGLSLAGLSSEPDPARTDWMLSPITSLLELTRDRAWTGRSAATAQAHWTFTLATLSLALVAWTVAAALRGRSTPPRLH